MGLGFRLDQYQRCLEALPSREGLEAFCALFAMYDCVTVCIRIMACMYICIHADVPGK